MIESNSLILKKEQFSITDVVSTLVEDLRNKVEKANDGMVRLVYEQYTENNIVVEGDSERIAQAISNLLDNATKFTKEGFYFN